MNDGRREGTPPIGQTGVPKPRPRGRETLGRAESGVSRDEFIDRMEQEKGAAGAARAAGDGRGKEGEKGARGMPRLLAAKKDATSCEKLRGGANDRRSGGVRMGQPVWLRTIHSVPRCAEGERGELKHLSTRRRREQK